MKNFANLLPRWWATGGKETESMICDMEDKEGATQMGKCVVWWMGAEACWCRMCVDSRHLWYSLDLSDILAPSTSEHQIDCWDADTIFKGSNFESKKCFFSFSFKFVPSIPLRSIYLDRIPFFLKTICFFLPWFEQILLFICATCHKNVMEYWRKL